MINPYIGHEQLEVKTERHFEEAGYQAQCVMQCKPPGAITALALQANWGLVGLGTSHGYALFDYRFVNQLEMGTINVRFLGK